MTLIKVVENEILRHFAQVPFWPLWPRLASRDQFVLQEPKLKKSDFEKMTLIKVVENKILRHFAQVPFRSLWPRLASRGQKRDYE